MREGVVMIGAKVGYALTMSRGPQAKECRSIAEVRKIKEVGSSVEPPEGMQPCPSFIDTSALHG